MPGCAQLGLLHMALFRHLRFLLLEEIFVYDGHLFIFIHRLTFVFYFAYLFVFIDLIAFTNLLRFLYIYLLGLLFFFLLILIFFASFLK